MRRLDVTLAFLVTAAALAPSIPELRGEHAVVMDLAVQAHKVYLLGTAGLARGDWDPYSYTGRPPFVDYPIIPFLPAVAVFKLTRNPYLACTVVDGLYRALPCWVWVLLRRAGAATRRTDAAALVYAGSLPAQIVEVFSTRVVTTFSLSLAVIAIMLSRSRLRRRWPVLLSWSAAAFGNPLYVLPAFLLEVINGPTILLAVIPAVPVMLLGYWYVRLAFTYTPGTWFLYSHAVGEKLVLAVGVAILDAISLGVSAKAGGGRLAAATAVGGLSLIPAGPIGPARFVDVWRTPVMTISVGVAESRRCGSELLRMSLASALVALVIFHALAISNAFKPERRRQSGPYRVLVDDGTGFESASPVWSGWPTYLLSGAFYQGASEPQLQSLGPALTILTLTQPSSDWYAVSLEWCRRSYEEVLERSFRSYLRALPLRRVDVVISTRPLAVAPPEVSQTDRRHRVEALVNPSLTLRDAIAVRRVRVLYVGSFSAYGILWAILAGKLGRPPIIPAFYPPAAESGQEMPPSNVPWTGEVLIVDRLGWEWSVKVGLVARAKRVIRVSSPLFPWKSGCDVGDAAEAVLPYVSERAVVRRGAVTWCEDVIHVRGVGSEFVVIPWGWAPFWSANGREGRVCPVGPFMLVHVGKGTAVLRYMGWERYQLWAYLASGVLLLAVLWGAGRKSL